MHLGSHAHGEVERGRAHAAADAHDEAALPRRQPGPLEHPPRREGGERVGGALLPGPPGRARPPGCGPARRPARRGRPSAARRGSGSRGRAVHRRRRRRSPRAGATAGFTTTSSPTDQPSTPSPTSSTMPATSQPGHVRQRRARLAAGEPEVHVVQGAGDGPHRDVAGAHRRGRRWCRSGTCRATRRGSSRLHRRTLAGRRAAAISARIAARGTSYRWNEEEVPCAIHGRCSTGGGRAQRRRLGMGGHLRPLRGQAARPLPPHPARPRRGGRRAARRLHRRVPAPRPAPRPDAPAALALLDLPARVATPGRGSAAGSSSPTRSTR